MNTPSPTGILRSEWVEPTTLELWLSDNRMLRLSFPEAGVIRCRYVTTAVFERIPTYGVAPDYAPQPTLLTESSTPEAIVICTERIRRADGGLEFFDRATGTCLLRRRRRHGPPPL